MTVSSINLTVRSLFFSQGVSYYTLSTQSSSIETKLALSVQKNQDITSELETCRSQLHAKERDFDQVKTEMEQVKKQLQESQDITLTKDKELDELKSQSVLQKVSRNIFRCTN